MSFQADIELAQRLRKMNSALRKKTSREQSEETTRRKNHDITRSNMRRKQAPYFKESHQTTFANIEEEPAPNPKRIFIPFKLEFEEALSSGVKTMTSRTFRAGREGDTFDAYGATFRILKVSEMKLEIVARDHFMEEGFVSMSAFIEFWNVIHPIKEYDPDQFVFAHKFERVSE